MKNFLTLLNFFFLIYIQKKKNQQDMLSGKAIMVSHLPQINRSREDQNYFEKWHIFKGWKHGCKDCEECDHHSNLYCKMCKKVAEGIYKQCECS